MLPHFLRGCSFPVRAISSAQTYHFTVYRIFQSAQQPHISSILHDARIRLSNNCRNPSDQLWSKRTLGLLLVPSHFPGELGSSEDFETKISGGYGPIPPRRKPFACSPLNPYSLKDFVPRSSSCCSPNLYSPASKSFSEFNHVGKGESCESIRPANVRKL